jgi:PAS domain S-box-containing protein
MIVALAAVLEIALVVIFSPARFTLGYYAGRLFSLLTSTIVLVVLLAETMRLYANLHELNETLEQRVQAETRERLQIWNVSQDFLVIAGLDGKVLSVNPTWTAILGWSDADLLDKPYEWLVHPDDLEKTRVEVGRLAKGHRTLHFENRLRDEDGFYHWISWAAATDSGRIYCMGRDFTEYKRAEEAIRESERSLRWRLTGYPVSLGCWPPTATSKLLIARSSSIVDSRWMNCGTGEQTGRSIKTIFLMLPKFSRNRSHPGYRIKSNNVSGASMANIAGLTTAASPFATTLAVLSAGMFC